MMKFSNIFKKPDDNKEPVPQGIKPEVRPEAQGAIPIESPKDTSSVRISSVLNKELEKISEATSDSVYADLLAKTRHIYTDDLASEHDLIPKLNPLVERVIDTLKAGNSEILLACLKDYPHMEGFLFYHVVNVCISSVAMGMSLGYDRPNLLELGVAALVHDIGMKKSDSINKPGMFSESDTSNIRHHPEDGANMLSEIDPAMNQRILNAVRQEHERSDGSGYPQGLEKNEIHEYAKIIGLADVYEAMMHKRPYREKYTSLETIRIILKNKKTYTRKVAKALLETFGLFPVNTLVQLNTKEIGIVVKPNVEVISRPVIDIIIDSYGKELKQPRRINMSENPVIYIDTCVKTQIGGTNP